MKRLFFSFIVVFSAQIAVLAQANGQNDGSKMHFYRMDVAQENDSVGKYERIEYGIQLPKNVTKEVDKFLKDARFGLNPFDPDQVDCRIELTDPKGTIKTRFAFYYKPFNSIVNTRFSDPINYVNEYQADTTNFPWHFRFAPDEIGQWTGKIILRVKGFGEFVQEGINFNCVKSTHKGYLAVSQTGEEKDRWMYYTETQEPFFAISNNLASGGYCSYLPSQSERHLKGLDELIEVGGNFTRFELGGQSALPDWPVYNNYAEKLDEMYGFDQLLKKCEQNDVYFILFRHHVEVLDLNDWDFIKWGTNPYKIGFKLNSVEEYFTKEEVIAWQKKNLRYIFARWGYSPNMAFYSYSEVDRWYSKLLEDNSDGADFKDGGEMNEKEASKVLYDWIKNQQDYIKKELNDKTMFVHSHATPSDLELKGVENFSSLSDVVAVHNYGETKDINFKNRYNQIEKFWNKYNKPVIMEEMGPGKIAMYCCSGIEYHNSIWSTAMMGDFGTGMEWWWDGGVHDMGYYKDLEPLANFFKNEDVRKLNYHAQKWEDVQFALDGSDIAKNNRTIENYFLLSENQENVLGWVHNATYYWRNLSGENPCMKRLIEGKTAESDPCYFAKDINGFPRNYDQYSCIPRVDNDVYQHEPLDGFDRFKDNYTDEGGPLKLSEDETFEIDGLKTPTFRPFNGKRHWYIIEFYPTSSGQNKDALKKYSQIVKASNNGKLKVVLPPTSSTQPDFAYKVKYIGYTKNSPVNF